MTLAKNGDQVKVHYTGTLNDGTVFDSSKDRDPLDFKLGIGQVIKGFDQAVEGLKVGESVAVNILAPDAYGEIREDLVIKVPSDQFPEGVSPEINQQFQIPQPNGTYAMVTVKEVNDDHVLMDGNHPMAGKDLNFEITLVEIDT
jgi:peptidylprolyl isomerase